MKLPRVQHYFDYKSPYAWLAQAENDRLEREYGVVVERLPYTLDIPSYLGSAEVDSAGIVLRESRNAHQWRRVRYSYMDCRREANRRGLVLRGPRKIFDSSLAHIGFLFATRVSAWQAYHEAVFTAFWRRELDIENPAALAGLLTQCGVQTAGFGEWLIGEGRALHDRIRAEAEAAGVFGVPSWVVDGELFWGAERIPRVLERIASRRA